MRLSYLNLSGTSLSGQIPSEILKLSNLVSLDLSVNDVPGSRVELQKPSFENLVEKLSNLKTLDLCDVSIDSMIPHNIGNLSSLTFVSLRNYELQGRIPSSIGNLSKLLHLDISLNELQGDLLGSIGNLRSLEAIYMSECNFSGQITSSLRNLTELLVLDMAQNSYGGTIELVLASILLPGNNGDLVTFDLSSNNLQGPLPVPPPGTVNYLAFSSSLTGEIPSWICNLNILESLVLSHNNLSGLLPQCLGNFSNELSVLDLQGNNFSGTIPNTFTKESRLGVMDLSHNLFQGRIPRSLINCSKLEFLGLGNNQISDTFPSWLGSLPKLNVVILRSNIFYGIIEEPRTGCGFSKFRIIDLSDNRFTGKLPSKSFLCWNAMKIVNASEVRYLQDVLCLKGRMMTYNKIPDILASIILSNNSFDGAISASIENLKGLQLLNLQNNNLQGHIPSCLGNLTNLESLDLSNNKFSGRIPQQLVQLTFLEFFNVSDNYLTGLIPQGKQFATFDNTSLDRNSGFCGRPLSKECESGEPPTIEDHTERSEESLFSGASDENHSDWLCGRTCGRIGSRVQLQHGNYRMDSGEVGNAAKGNKEEEEDT
ncbi:Receptor-like protein 43 [Citrus sinensis]|nr:Receptor-like protein 43 [Citrus sinensis]